MVTRIGRDEVRALIDEGAYLVEVLPREEFEEEHIAGAINIPLKELDATRVESLDRGRAIIVYCQDTL